MLKKAILILLILILIWTACAVAEEEETKTAVMENIAVKKCCHLICQRYVTPYIRARRSILHSWILVS